MTAELDPGEGKQMLAAILGALSGPLAALPQDPSA